MEQYVVKPTRDNGVPIMHHSTLHRARVYLAEGWVNGLIENSTGDLHEVHTLRKSTSRKHRVGFATSDYQKVVGAGVQSLPLFSYQLTATKAERRRVYEGVRTLLISKGFTFNDRDLSSLVVGGAKIAARYALESTHKRICKERPSKESTSE